MQMISDMKMLTSGIAQAKAKEKTKKCNEVKCALYRYNKHN